MIFAGHSPTSAARFRNNRSRTAIHAQSSSRSPLDPAGCPVAMARETASFWRTRLSRGYALSWARVAGTPATLAG